jgi:hypothetical protein
MASRPAARLSSAHRFGAHLSGAVLAGGISLAAASCGSRTGLFAEEGDGSARTNGGDARPDGRNMPDANPCIPGKFTLEVATAQLMFVLDRSGSMNFGLNSGSPAGPGEASRWDVLRDALRRTVLPYENEIAMGAKFYPEPPPDDATSEEACRTDEGVGFPPARGGFRNILEQFSATVPRGGTPTAEAVRLAAQFLTAQRGVSRTLVLATDGAPNCNPDLDPATCVCTTSRSCRSNPSQGRYSCLDDSRAIDAIRDIAVTQRIPVYVIGIGGNDSAQFVQALDRMAVAGGRARATTPYFYNVQVPADLSSALQSIRDSVASCTFLTPSSPVDPNAISVEVDGEVIARDTTRTNGWDWVDQAYGTIAFFGDACTRAGSTQVSGVVTCASP